MSYLNTLTKARNSSIVTHHLKSLNHSVRFSKRTTENRNMEQKAPQSVGDFLLSIAGMFSSSSPSNTSENVKAIVAEAISSKYGKR